MQRIYVLVGLTLLLVVLRVSSPVDLFEGDQEKQVGYVMDILHHGNVAVQYEVNGKVATKPPFYNWCAALVCTVFGTTAPWAMKLPSLLAGLGLLACIYLLSRRLFDERVAFWATLACMASHHFAKLFWFARTDMLMTFSLYLAVVLVLILPSSWYKSAVVGGALGASFLTKGPVGPALFGLWLVLYAWNGRESVRPDRWKEWARVLLPGVVVFVVIAALWLGVVWDRPQFQSVVLGKELGDRLSGAAHSVKPFYYYVPVLLGRIAPWPLAAIAGLLLARRRSEWPAARFAGLWALAFLLFFSVVPGKRHDLLLPVYPPVFMLAGLGLRYLMDMLTARDTSRLSYPVACLLVASPGLLFLSPPEAVSPILWGVALLMPVCGFFVFLSARRSKSLFAIWVAAAFIVGNNLYFQGFGNAHDLSDYGKLRAFVEPVREDARAGRVLVWRANSLVSYELGLHQRGIELESLPHPPQWLITEGASVDEIGMRTGWSLEEKSRLVLERKQGDMDARLFLVRDDAK